MRRTLLVLTTALAAIIAGAPVMSGETGRWPGRARYSVPTPVLDAALECARPSSGAGRGEPVLLVHGTGFEREHNFAWNYWRSLQAEDFEVCWIRLPYAALGDIQIAAQYVARAVEVMYARSGRRIDVLGHSQGGVVARWAIRFFPSGRVVDDYVALAAPNHGAVAADIAAASGETAEAVWQMRVKARLMDALNRGDETSGPVSYTSIFTAADEIVQPASTAALDGASNILIQDVCPGRVVTHISIVVDAMAYALARDAFRNRGPADPTRVGPLPCFGLTMPGAGPAVPTVLPDWSDDVIVRREPPLMPYARR